MSLRASLVVAALALALPEQCNALLAKGRAAGRAPASSASAMSAPTATAPPAATGPVATTPPVWAPPESVAHPVASAPPEHESAHADGGKQSAEMKKALVAFDAGDHKKVRALLEKKVRAGKGTPDEVHLVLASCSATDDKKCVDAVSKLLVP